MKAKFRVYQIDRNGNKTKESIEVGVSGSKNVQSFINFTLDNIRVQCAFSHLTKYKQLKYYSDSDQVRDDIGDDLQYELLDYIFEYPKAFGQKKYKFINIRGKRYLQEWRRVDGRYRFTRRFKVQGLKQAQERKIEVSRELI